MDSVACADLSLTHNSSMETCSTAEAARGHHVLDGLTLADPGITQNLEASQKRCCARTERSGCVVASPKAAARGDAAHAAFERKLRHCRKEILELLSEGVLYRPPVWTVDWRLHLASIRTLQYAADIASSRDGQQMSDKSLQHGWKHEVQIALL